MRIVRPDKLVITDRSEFYSKERVSYKPFTRYVVSDFEHHYLEEHTPQTEWLWSSFNAYERRYGGQDLNGKSVVIYRHTAYGDQLMVSAIPRYLKSLYPDAKVHLYCDPAMQCMWEENPYVEGGAISIPMHLDAVKDYDYHILFEGMLECNSEPDQSCCYDDMFGFIGLDPQPQWKRPHFHLVPKDYRTLRDLKVVGRKYIVYHWAPANRNRCYPYEQSYRFLRLFKDTHPDWIIFTMGICQDKKWMDDLDKYAMSVKGYMNLVNRTPVFRQLAPLVEGASLVVCPDSAVMHLAAAFSTPTISLWGLFAPQDRAKYYPNHYPLFKGQGVCPYSPCHDHNFHLPLNQCQEAAGAPMKDEIQWCQALASILPEEIMATVEEVLGNRRGGC